MAGNDGKCNHVVLAIMAGGRGNGKAILRIVRGNCLGGRQGDEAMASGVGGRGFGSLGGERGERKPCGWKPHSPTRAGRPRPQWFLRAGPAWRGA